MEENNKDGINLEEMMEQKEPELVLSAEEDEKTVIMEETVHLEIPEEEPEESGQSFGFGDDSFEPAQDTSPEPQETGIMGGGVIQLRKIKDAMEELSRSEEEYRDTEKYLKGKTKELEIQKKRVEEKVASAVKKARADLEKGYDEEITVAEKAIKEAENERKTAKSAAVNERMKRENSTLVDDNKVLSAEIKSRFKDAGVPSICNSTLYYSLFEPKKLTDFLICMAAILIFAGIIPFAVIQLIDGTVFKVLVWILIVVFFAAIYFLISYWTKKGSRNDALQEMRSKVNQIRDNKKAIRSRNKNIKADPDESQYNLYEYDQQLEAARADLEKAKADREQAMEHFDQVESVQIREELEQEKAPLFEQMETEIAAMQEDCRQKEELFREASNVMDEYNAALGDKGWKADKIDELISIIEEGKATTIREALNVQKNK